MCSVLQIQDNFESGRKVGFSASWTQNVLCVSYSCNPFKLSASTCCEVFISKV